MTPFTRRAALAGAGALAASGALAQTPAAQMSPAAPAAPVRVTLTTALGPIVLELATDKAPVTCANFLRYVAAHRFDGASFYRADKVLADPLIGLVQGGVKNDPARSFPPIAHESTKATGLSNTNGAVSMARYDPGTATSEFFICVGDLSSLDADPSQPGDNQGFAVFAHVVEGMEVVKKILLAPVSATAGEGAMKGQMLDPEIAITTAARAA